MLCTDCVHFTVMSDLVVCTILIYIVTTKDISKKREKSRSRGRKQARQEQHTKKHDRDACTQLHKDRTTTAVRRKLLLHCDGGSGWFSGDVWPNLICDAFKFFQSLRAQRSYCLSCSHCGISNNNRV